jgi:RimJ/RimL family protein N-acetyltransferase
VTEINEYGQEVGTPLPQWQGAEQLRRKTLTGRYCRLETLCAQTHAADLYDAYAQAEDERDWTWLASRRPQSVADTQTWLLLKTADPSLVPFAVIDSRSDRAVGLVCLMAIDRANGTVEIGHVTWSPRMKNSVLGTETVWLLLREAFACGYRRVEWKCDSLNTASRRAAERLGFTFEGRFRQKIVRKGRNRDSDWLSIIDGEWPERDAVLQAWLEANNFTSEGQQRRSMHDVRQALSATPRTAE